MLGGLTMADLLDQLLDSIDTLTEEQFQQLLSLMKVKEAEKNKGKTVVNKEETEIVEPQPCVHCGSINTKKHGAPNGRQRFICKDCGKTFSTSTGAVLSHSRLTPEQWRELLRCLINNLSIGDIAKNVGIARSSAWINKQKVCVALMTLYGNQDKFVDIAECDEYYVPVSFKGKRDPDFFINTLGRMPRHHMTYDEKIEWLEKYGFMDELKNDPEKLSNILYSGDKYLRGISRDQTCILTCQDRNGNLFMNPTCIGRMETDDVSRELHGRFESDAIMVTDSHKAYPNFAANEHIQLEQIESGKHAKGAFNLGRINALHSEIAKYWSKQQERIPSTKYTDLGLILFWWLRKNKDLSISEQIEKLYEIVQDQHVTTEAVYETIRNRKLSLNTKGCFPNAV